MNYMINAKMGFDRKYVYNIRLQDNDFDLVKNHYSQIPEIKNISAASHVPGVGHIHDTDIRVNIDDEKQTGHYFSVDENYLDVMGLELIKGNNFPENLSKENESLIIASESFIKRLNLGTPAEAIGKSVIIDDSTLVQIIGVIKDYKYVALFLPERPLFLRYKPSQFRVAALRIDGGTTPSLIVKLKTEWDKLDQNKQFEGEFLDAEIKDYYSFFEDILYAVAFASALAIVIACLGLLGMATYSAQTKIKEIGVRKVYGATNKSIVKLISKTYLKLFIIASVIAAPLAYLINNAWLQYIAHHTSFGFGTIFIGIFTVIVFGMLTITSQTLKAANINPAQSLRYE